MSLLSQILYYGKPHSDNMFRIFRHTTEITYFDGIKFQVKSTASGIMLWHLILFSLQFSIKLLRSLKISGLVTVVTLKLSHICHSVCTMEIIYLTRYMMTSTCCVTCIKIFEFAILMVFWQKIWVKNATNKGELECEWLRFKPISYLPKSTYFK